MALVLGTTLERKDATEDTASRPHTTTKEILAAPTKMITPWAFGTHPDTKEPSEAQAYIYPVCLYDC